MNKVNKECYKCGINIKNMAIIMLSKELWLSIAGADYKKVLYPNCMSRLIGSNYCLFMQESRSWGRVDEDTEQLITRFYKRR